MYNKILETAALNTVRGYRMRLFTSRERKTTSSEQLFYTGSQFIEGRKRSNESKDTLKENIFFYVFHPEVL